MMEKYYTKEGKFNYIRYNKAISRQIQRIQKIVLFGICALFLFKNTKNPKKINIKTH